MNMLDQSERFGGYLHNLPIALSRAGSLKWWLFGCWFAYPTLAVTSKHWEDAAGLSYYLRGDLVPRVFSSADMQRATLGVIAAWVLLLLITFVLTVKFYRRTSIGIRLWPVALVLVGGVLNFAWWMYKGHFDPPGCIAGMVPVVVMGIVQRITDKLGHDFVFGGARATASPDYDLP
jgi:hypothetical protein